MDQNRMNDDPIVNEPVDGDETEREWDGRQWAGEPSGNVTEQGHWNRHEWEGDQGDADRLTHDADRRSTGDDVLPGDESIPREDLGRDRPGGPQGFGHNPERAHWADTDGDR